MPSSPRIVTMSDAFSVRERKCSSLFRRASSTRARSSAVASTGASACTKSTSGPLNSRGCALYAPSTPHGRSRPCTTTPIPLTIACSSRWGGALNRISEARSAMTTGPAAFRTYPARDAVSAVTNVLPTQPSCHPSPARTSRLRCSGFNSRISLNSTSRPRATSLAAVSNRLARATPASACWPRCATASCWRPPPRRLVAARRDLAVVDLEGNIVSHNRHFEEMWHLPTSLIAANNDAAGRGRLIAHVRDQLVNPQLFVDGIQDRYVEPESDSFDVLILKDGHVLERYSIPLRLNGRSVGRVWSFRDVTARRRAECVQEAVYRISHTAHTADNLLQLLRAIHEIVGELMPAKNFYVSLYDAENDRLEFPYFVDEYDTARDIPPRKLRKGLTEYVLRTGQPLLATPEVYEQLVAAGEAELIGAPSIDWLGVPLKVKDRTIGVVVTQTYSQGVRYGEGERDILTFVSSQMAMAIERKRVEDAWREQSEVLQRIVDNIPVMLVFLGDQGRIQWGNREWTRTLGYDIAEARERDIFAELHPDPAERQRLRDSIGAPVGQWTDFRTRTKRGAVLDTIWANAPLTGGGWLAIGMDVSDRRRAEERYRSFIAQSSEGVSRLEIDPPVPIKLPDEEQIDRLYAGARIAECNDAMARMYGYGEARELIGTRLADLHNVTDPTNREQIRAFIRAGYRVSDSEPRED